jgi:Na+/glutamate symporter
MSNFWDFSVWGTINLAGSLIVSMLVANMIKRSIPMLKNSLIPTSVLGGLLLLAISIIYETATGVPFFDTAVFGGIFTVRYNDIDAVFFTVAPEML